MKPTDVLKSEHRVIEQVLNCLAKIAEQAVTAKTVDVASARQAIDFFKVFADQCHHGKEEKHLFPAMEARGFVRDSGPTGVMLYEHDLGRQRIRGMAEALDQHETGDNGALDKFVENARGYVALLRDHINKEDHCLFTMANQALTVADQQALLTAFEHVEHDEMHAGTHEKYLEIANNLAEKFNVPLAAETTQPGAFVCAHGHKH